MYHTGRLDEAVQAFEQCSAIRADQPEVMRIHAQALKDLGNFKKAEQVLKQAHTLDQRNAKTLEQKGHLLFESGRPQQAIRDFSKCASLEPWNSNCAHYKALSNLNMGKLYQGVKDLQTKGKYMFGNVSVKI